MGGDGGLLGGVGEFLFGDPTKDTKKAYEQSTGYTREAMAVQRQMQEKAVAAFTEQMNKALAEYNAGQPQALNAMLAGTQAGIAGSVAGAQTQADLLRYGAAAAEQARQPTQVARLGALQALPQLQQFIGTQAFNVPTSVQTPAMPETNFMNAYSAALPGAGQITQGMAGALPAPASAVAPASEPGVGSAPAPVSPYTPIAGAPASSTAASPAPAATALTPYTGPAFNYQESPIYKLQQEQTTRNINRALAARGLAGGAPAAAVQGEAARELSAAEAERAYSRLMDQVNIGLGYDTSSPYAQAAAAMGGVYGNLGNTVGSSLGQLGANAANLYGQSAANRAQLYQNYGQGLAQAYTGMGAAQGQGLLSLGQNAVNYGNTLAATPSAGSQLINLGLTAYGAGMFGGGGGGFGTGYQFPASTYAIPNVMMRQFTNPYGFGG